MPQSEIFGSATPGLEGAPRSQMHDNRAKAPQGAAGIAPEADQAKEDTAHEVSGASSTQ